MSKVKISKTKIKTAKISPATKLAGQNYPHQKIETKWQKVWAEKKIYQTNDKSSKPKAYVLDMFPYPSGEGLHVGHILGYTATDIYSRYLRMTGNNVLHPMGWDAFGLPAENFALKHKVNPAVSTKKNIDNFRRQIKSIGLSYDWSREINTTNPDYYRWTQWIFLQLYKQGLAYESYEPINWCPSCQTGLANEDLEDGKCERCGTVVEKKPMRQWVLKITNYAERLLTDLDQLKWPESVKEAQRNWIGKSEGAEIDFPLANKRHYVLLPGFASNSKRSFFPWLKRELEAKGHSVQALDLPDARIPNIANQIEAVLKQVKFGPDTILVGHSWGAVVALKILEKLKTPIAGTILVAGLIEPAVKNRESWPLRLIFNWRFTWPKIKKNAGWVKILRDLKDPLIADNQGLRIQQELGGDLIEFEAEKAHVCGKVEPVVLEHCLEKIKIFTTRPDTLFGATYLVLAPEHQIIQNLIRQPSKKIKNLPAIKNYLTKTKKRTEIERTAEGRDKTGVKIEGLEAINPANGEIIPIYIADYVLVDYGFGAIMAVPAHDQRDWVFAKKFKLPIKLVIWDRQKLTDKSSQIVEDVLEQAYVGEGILVNSDNFSGLSNQKAKIAITKFVRGHLVTKYKLRDWVFSRQRYWGEPIPIIHCANCALNNPVGRGIVPVPEKDLPVKLPVVKSYAPTGTGESPLADITNWVRVKCPVCGAWAKRETNTMPQWAGSSWYYLRFIDPTNKKFLADPKKLQAWLGAGSPLRNLSQANIGGVSMYVGGVEHATRHLIYARFWHKFLFDLKIAPGSEPFSQLKNQGLVLGPDGRKMSKRWSNVINPDDVVRDYGADSLRLYEMFMGPFEQSKNWNSDNLMGVRRFLDRVWRLSFKVSKTDIKIASDLESLQQKTIQKVSQDIENFSFNTAVSTLMIMANNLELAETISRSLFKDFLKLLAPLAPHLTEELWSNLGEKRSIHLATWPIFEPSKIKINSFKIIIQINGKVRDSFQVEVGTSEAEIKKLALLRPIIIQWTKDQKISRMVYVPDKLLNLVLA